MADKDSLDNLLTIIATFEIIQNYQGRAKAVEYANSLDSIPRLLLKRYDEIQTDEEENYLALQNYASTLSGEHRNELDDEE